MLPIMESKSEASFPMMKKNLLGGIAERDVREWKIEWENERKFESLEEVDCIRKLLDNLFIWKELLKKFRVIIYFRYRYFLF